MYTREQAVAAFWAKVDVLGPDECWPWKGSQKGTGYGYVRWEGKNVRTHRLAFFLSNAYLPEGKNVCHTCDNPPCCNPIHLFAGTQKENMEDCSQKGRTARRHKGKLTNFQVIELRQLHEQGIPYSKLAGMFGISKAGAHAIGTRICYKEVQ